MHSRIYQVSENPISQDKLSREHDYEFLVGSVADYVAEVAYKSIEYISDLEWLQSATDGLEIDTEKGTLIIKSKKEYFEKKYDTFKEYLQRLQDVTLEEFIKDKAYFEVYFEICELKSAYNDNHAFYINSDDDCETLDSFVRFKEENKVYYIGSIMDYHF